MNPKFVHLHLHSEYSLADSLIRIGTLPKALIAGDMPAVALTDRFNLFALVKFYKELENAGIKPIIGVDALIHNSEVPERPFRIILLAQNTTGYRNLTNLISQGYQYGQRLGIPYLQRNWIHKAPEGLIVLSGGREGDVGQALLTGYQDRAHALITQWTSIFGNRYYLQLVRTGREHEENYIQQAITVANERSIPVVATNEVCFLSPKDFEAHEARVCIHHGNSLNDPQRPRYYSSEQYLRTPKEMAKIFADIPEALENSVAIAERCNLEINFGKNYLPKFPTPNNISLEDALCEQARQGLTQRLKSMQATPEQEQAYTARLERELGVINQMGFAGYFLIVADFIQWAKDNGIPVGPGRGSGAGSLVAYSLKITDLNPIPYDLLFERFLNPERVSMPDFDIDFCMEGRDRVIEYVAKRYGRDAVSQIITYGSMAAKAVIRDVGRVLGMPYPFVDRIAKLIPTEIGMTLNKALQGVEELRNLCQEDDNVAALISMGKTLEGLPRNVGKHAGGVVIAPGKLTDFTPLYCEEDGSNLVTQFDKKDIEQVGLVKFDFLGLRTLTVIDWTVKNIQQLARSGECTPIDINNIPLDDPASFELLKRADTTAVFQLESRGMRELMRRLQPDTFEDIVALVALFRPGPLGSGMVDDFIQRKHGAKIEYPHPALETILKSTYGVILYQEQVMQIAQVLAGFTLGAADVLRSAMGKKIQSAMDKQRIKFIDGAVSNNVDKNLAGRIFDLMAEFAKYGFNKSHSAAYALIAYQTAWLKTHHPAAFMAAVLSADMDNIDKIPGLVEECKHMRLEIQAPDVNASDYRFVVKNPTTILYGLGAIKNVGAAAIETILGARATGGIFSSLFDLCRRIDLRKANRRVLESMLKAGALDALCASRATALLQLPHVIKAVEQYTSTETSGVVDLFQEQSVTAVKEPDLSSLPIAAEEWSEGERLQQEKSVLGLYVTGHPIDAFVQELRKIATCTIAELLASCENSHKQHSTPERKELRRVTLAGLVSEIKSVRSSRGRMGVITLDDRSARIEITLFADAFQEYRDILKNEQILVIHGNLQYDDYRKAYAVRADKVLTLDQARVLAVDQLDLFVAHGQFADYASFIGKLRGLIELHQGGNCAVALNYHNDSMEGTIRLGSKWKIQPSAALLKEFQSLVGSKQVCFHYKNQHN
ncbi:DNA polymerase III subunit alpha [Achromatium sp. WMS2]|nr:DNA polymerase III subunit alpha [Achromatium sp. WMS2]